MESSICDIEKLVDLFQFANRENQLDDEGDFIQDPQSVEKNDIDCSSNQNKPNSKSTKKKQNPYAKIEPPERREVLDPDDLDSEGLYFGETPDETGLKDWKKTPKWDISYRQSVTASDVFLGMGFKNASTSSCENMLVTVDLPGENRQNIDLKIEKEKLILTTPKFYLDMKLPHPVDPKRGNAEFEKQGEKLIITLIMERELDIVNF